MCYTDKSKKPPPIKKGKKMKKSAVEELKKDDVVKCSVLFPRFVIGRKYNIVKQTVLDPKRKGSFVIDECGRAYSLSEDLCIRAYFEQDK